MSNLCYFWSGYYNIRINKLKYHFRGTTTPSKTPQNQLPNSQNPIQKTKNSLEIPFQKFLKFSEKISMALPETTKIEIKNGCWIRVHNVTCNLPVSFAVGSWFFVSNFRQQHHDVDEGTNDY